MAQKRKPGVKGLPVSLTVFLCLCACAVSVLLLPDIVRAEQDVDVTSVLERLERNVTGLGSLKADFIQEKTLASFKNKIVLKGRVFMQKPQRLAWHVDEPLRYSVLITDRLVRQWDDMTGEVQEIGLSSNPVLKTVLQQMTLWFQGRFVTLCKDYDVNLIGQNPLVLGFSPKADSAMGEVIKNISIGFRDDERYLSWIKIIDATGDSTSIKFQNTVLNPTLDESAFEVKGRA